jgi:hypothetical protein
MNNTRSGLEMDIRSYATLRVTFNESCCLLVSILRYIQGKQINLTNGLRNKSSSFLSINYFFIALEMKRGKVTTILNSFFGYNFRCEKDYIFVLRDNSIVFFELKEIVNKKMSYLIAMYIQSHMVLLSGFSKGQNKILVQY